jgi:hypothetical protein
MVGKAYGKARPSAILKKSRSCGGVYPVRRRSGGKTSEERGGVKKMKKEFLQYK